MTHRPAPRSKPDLPKDFLIPPEMRIGTGTVEEWLEESLEESAKRIVTIRETDFNKGTK